ncbi:MAG: hypothetical protein ACREFI_17975, partial [Stellaceae bacterium]
MSFPIGGLDDVEREIAASRTDVEQPDAGPARERELGRNIGENGPTSTGSERLGKSAPLIGTEARILRALAVRLVALDPVILWFQQLPRSASHEIGSRKLSRSPIAPPMLRLNWIR